MRTLNGRLLDLVRELDGLGKEPTLAALGHAMQRSEPDSSGRGGLRSTKFADLQSRSGGRAGSVRFARDDLASRPGQRAARSFGLHLRDAGRAGRGGRGLLPRGPRRLRGPAIRDGGALRGGPGRARRRRAHRAQRVLDRGIAGDRACVFTTASGHPPVPAATRAPRRSPQRDRNRTPTIVIVGGGFSGTMAAAQTLRTCATGGVDRQGGSGRTTGSHRRRAGVQHAGSGSPAQCSGRTHERLARSPGRFCSMGFAPLRRGAAHRFPAAPVVRGIRARVAAEHRRGGEASRRN